MRKYALLLIGLLITSLPAAAERRAEHVFIVSFDMGGGEVLRNQPAPAFKQMFAEGAATWWAFTIVPSITLPSHVSMLTGVGIQEHQIDWNNDREEATLPVPSILTLANRAGLKTAMFVGKDKLKLLEAPGDAAATFIGKDAGESAAEFAKRLGDLKPDLCFIHFAEIDSIGHRHGVGSPEQNQAVADCDAALAVIRDAVKAAGMEETSVFILTADHGAHNEIRDGKTVGVHGSSKPSDVEIPWVARGKGAKKGAALTAPILTYDTAATALWLLGIPVPESFWGKPVTSAFE